MNLRGLRWPRLVLSLALSLGLLIGGAALFQRQSVERPLVGALTARPGVENVELLRRDHGTVVRVRLARIDNLQREYEAIERAAHGVRGLGPFRIELVDRRDAVLEAAYYRFHFALQEANATGRFVQMAEQLQSAAREAGIEEPRVYVSAERIYVSLYHGDRYLYEVVPRARPAARTGEGV